jgi:hypothetical protein
MILKFNIFNFNFFHFTLKVLNILLVFADVLPDALETDCTKCSETQKSGAKKVLEYLVKNKRDWFDELSAKYDPTGKYKARFPELFE